MNPVGGPGGIGAPGGGRTMQDILAMRQEVLQKNQFLQELRQNAASGANKPERDMALAPASEATETQAGGGFADSLKGALQDVSATQKRASDLAAAYERGEVTDIAQVMLARQESGLAFEATLQVRNKLMSAYQDIMRMGI